MQAARGERYKNASGEDYSYLEGDKIDDDYYTVPPGGDVGDDEYESWGA